MRNHHKINAVTERVQSKVSRDQNSIPLLTRLEKQYLFSQKEQKNSQNHEDKLKMKEKGKQNTFHMINSVPYIPTSHIKYGPKKNIQESTIKIDNYENRRFKTQEGYEPMMTKSRYGLVASDSDDQIQMVNSQSLQKFPPNQPNFENRPLTFGLMNKPETNLKTSVQYRQDNMLKNKILEQMNQLRKSQQSLALSKQYPNILRCSNHPNKKAKYRLIEEIKDEDDHEQMVYCSKCAINLLQQKFNVEEIGKKQANNNKAIMLKSQEKGYLSNSTRQFSQSSARIQEMRSFEHKLNEVEIKIQKNLNCSKQITDYYELQKHQNNQIYNYFIQLLTQIRNTQLQNLHKQQNQHTRNWSEYEKDQINERESIKQMKRELKEYRNKFITMKEEEFQFLMSSFSNKIHEYGKDYRMEEKTNFAEKVKNILCVINQQGNILHGAASLPVVNNQKQCGQSLGSNNFDEEFICEEIKRPFRTLFPDDSQVKDKKYEKIVEEEEISAEFQDDSQTYHESSYESYGLNNYN